jgi:TonB family protein
MSWLIDYTLRASLVLTLAFLVSRIFNRRPAALKHLVWSCAFCIALLLPLFLQFGPKYRVVRELLVEPAQTTVSVSAVAATVPARPPVRSIPYIEIAWIAGIIVFAARLWKGQRDARTLVRNARQLSSGIAESDAISSPLTTGIWKPYILLPAEHRDWDPVFLKSAIEHELAHVRRRDCLVQWLPNIVCVVQWFNPLVWLARAEMLCESERACDDAVIRSGAKGSAFARDLVDVARSICTKGNSSMSIALTTKLERRIARLLDASANRNPLNAARVIPAALAALALLAPIAGIRGEQVTKVKTIPPLAAVVVPKPVAAPSAPQKATPHLIAQAQQTPRSQPPTAPTLTDVPATGTFSGTVTDPTGAVVPNARILVTSVPQDDTVKPNIYSTLSGPLGQWSLGGLPAGRYTVDVSVPGFTGVRMTFASQEPGFNFTFPARLTIGRVMESLTVSAPAKTVNAEAKTTIGGVAGKPVRVGGNLQAARLIHKVDPIYPQAALDRGLQGPVTFMAVIDKQGFIRNNPLVTNNAAPELVQAGLDAIRLWQFEPTKLNGEPVEIVTEITVNFQLETAK